MDAHLRKETVEGKLTSSSRSAHPTRQKTSLTTVCTHVDLQRAGAGAAFVALWERADALVGVRLFGLVLGGRRGRSRLLLPAGAVVHEVGLQVPLTAVPDPTVFAWKNILC